MHQSSHDLCSNFVADHLNGRGVLRVADVGSQDINGTYRNLFVRDGWEYVGFDQSPGRNVDVVLTPETLAEHASTFDVVISGQTLEHVAMPWLWISDLVMLAKLGGLVWVVAPNSFAFHEYPIDCWRVWPDGLNGLFEFAGLEVIHCRKVGIDTYGLARRQ